MKFLDAVSRAALGWVFVQSGTSVLRKPEPHARKAAPVLGVLRRVVPPDLPEDVVIVRANAAAQLAGGAALIAGVAPRLAAAGLFVSIIPTTAGGHRFWELETGAERNTQRNHFLKNISIAGGLLHVVITPRRRLPGEERA